MTMRVDLLKLAILLGVFVAMAAVAVLFLVAVAVLVGGNP